MQNKHNSINPLNNFKIKYFSKSTENIPGTFWNKAYAYTLIKLNNLSKRIAYIYYSSVRMGIKSFNIENKAYTFYNKHGVVYNTRYYNKSLKGN